MQRTLKQRPLLNPAFKRVQRLPAPLPLPALSASNVTGRLGPMAQPAPRSVRASRQAEESAMPA